MITHMVSQSQELAGHWRGSDSNPGQPLDHGLQPIASVEAALKFGEVSRRVLLVNRMAGSAQGVLEVPQHGVDPLEALQFHAFAASASDHGSVPAACVNHAGETAQSVGDDLAAPGDTLSNVAGDFGLAEAPDTAELHPNRLLITRLHRCQEGDLVLRAARLLTAD